MQQTELIGQVTIAFTSALDKAEVTELRAAFSSLMDKAAEAIQPTGFDQDDVILERRVIVHDATDFPPRQWTVALDVLTEARDLVKAMDQTRIALDLPACRPAQVTISALQIAILRETDIPLPDLRVPWDYDPNAS